MLWFVILNTVVVPLWSNLHNLLVINRLLVNYVIIKRYVFEVEYFTRYPGTRAMDLTAGTLYAAQWQQISADNGGRADLNWISLGHATHSEIADYLKQNIRFNDIFEKVEPSGEGVCPSGYTSINAGHEADQYGNYHRCLKLKPGMERAASRLETRRYAAMLGATTELRKEEGISFNPLTKIPCMLPSAKSVLAWKICKRTVNRIALMMLAAIIT